MTEPSERQSQQRFGLENQWLRSAQKIPLRGLARGARWLGERETDRRAGLERAPETELLAHLAERRQHFFAQQADARPRVLIRNEPVTRPEPDDRRARLLEQPSQLRDHGL